MADIIQHKRSTVSGSVPAANQLSAGELALNTADGKLFFKKNDDVVVDLDTAGVDAGATNVLFFKPDLSYDRAAVNPAVAFQWQTLSSWYRLVNAAYVPATALPDQDTIVYIRGPLDSHTLSTPPVVRALDIEMATTDLVDFGSVGVKVLGAVTVKAASRIQGTLVASGTVTFNAQSVMYGGTITGTVVFNNQTGKRKGTINGNVTFNNSAQHNSGTINGNVVFNNSSANDFYGVGESVFTGTVVFNNTSYNASKITAPSVTFAGTSVNRASGEVIGNAVFQDSGLNRARAGAITGTLSGTNDSSYWGVYPTLYFKNVNDVTGNWDNIDNWFLDAAATIASPIVPGIESDTYHVVVIPGATKMTIPNNGSRNVRSFTAKIYSADTANLFNFSATVLAREDVLLAGDKFVLTPGTGIEPMARTGIGPGGTPAPAYTRAVDTSATWGQAYYNGNTAAPLVFKNVFVAPYTCNSTDDIVLIGTSVLAYGTTPSEPTSFAATISLFDSAQIVGSHPDLTGVRNNLPGETGVRLYDNSSATDLNIRGNVIAYHASALTNVTSGVSSNNWYGNFEVHDQATATNCLSFSTTRGDGRATLSSMTMVGSDNYLNRVLNLYDFVHLAGATIHTAPDGGGTGGNDTALIIESRNVKTSGTIAGGDEGGVTGLNLQLSESDLRAVLARVATINVRRLFITQFSLSCSAGPALTSINFILPRTWLNTQWYPTPPGQGFSSDPGSPGSAVLTFSNTTVSAIPLNLSNYNDFLTITFTGTSAVNNVNFSLASSPISGAISARTLTFSDGAVNNGVIEYVSPPGGDPPLQFIDGTNNGTIKLWTEHGLWFTGTARNLGTIDYAQSSTTGASIGFYNAQGNNGGTINVTGKLNISFTVQSQTFRVTPSFNHLGTINDNNSPAVDHNLTISGYFSQVLVHNVNWTLNTNYAFNISSTFIDGPVVVSFSGTAQCQSAVLFTGLSGCHFIFSNTAKISSTGAINWAPGMAPKVTFKDTARNDGTLNTNSDGTTTFYDSSVNNNSLTSGTVNFKESSSNTVAGTVDLLGGTATFADASNNNGTVTNGTIVCTTSGTCTPTP